jgi:N-acetylneuraminic acid mutarotase
MIRWNTLRCASMLAVMMGGAISCQHLSSKSPAQVRVESAPLLSLEGVGLAAAYAGESNGALVLAGGTNFPGDPPWKKGKKVWHDEIWAYDGKHWNRAGTLTPATAGGSCITTPSGIICIGGGDATTVYTSVFRLRYEKGAIAREELPALPKPLMASSAVQLGNRVYVVGGHNQLSPLIPGPSGDTWSIDLSALDKGWRAESPLPAEPRWLPIVGTDGKSLFVVSGFTRMDSPDGKPAIHCLSDVWNYEPATDGKGAWKRLADLPRANAAAPSPAPVVSGKLLLMGGGVDDSILHIPMDQQKGFPFTITAVDTKTGQADVIGEVRSSVVVGPVVPWKDGIVIINGEIRSGVRTPSVWFYRFK